MDMTKQLSCVRGTNKSMPFKMPSKIAVEADADAASQCTTMQISGKTPSLKFHFEISQGVPIKLERSIEDFCSALWSKAVGDVDVISTFERATWIHVSLVLVVQARTSAKFTKTVSCSTKGTAIISLSTRDTYRNEFHHFRQSQ